MAEDKNNHQNNLTTTLTFRCVKCKDEVSNVKLDGVSLSMGNIGHSITEDAPGYIMCKKCGLEGTLDILYDYEMLREKIAPKDISQRKEYSVGRYAEFLPVPYPLNECPITVGWTPLVKVPRVANAINLKNENNLFIKDDSRLPSGSLKDRASIIAALDAKRRGFSKVATASTGNAAASLATICAALGLKAVIFVPYKAPKAKLAQLQMCGAELYLVNGTYDDAMALCAKVCKKYGWYNRSTSVNPFTSDGKKTVAFEIWEQCGCKEPSRVFVSVGDGCIIGGVFKGFYDLLQMGWIKKLPKIYGVQAEGSSVIAKSFEKKILKPVKPSTYADSISVEYPADYFKAWRAIEDSKGAFVVVKDEEIQKAASILASNSGIFGEPSGVASLAGLVHLINDPNGDLIEDNECIVCMVTGSGLKDVDGAMKACKKLPEPISKSIDEFQSV